MKLTRAFALSAAFAAWFGSAMVSSAADVPVAKKVVVSAPIPDVALTADGVLTGLLVNDQGKPVIGAKVTVTQGRQEVAESKTNAKGEFELPVSKTGVYQISSGKQAGVVRAWTQRSAPPTAKKQALLVTGNGKVVRAQGELAGLGMGGAVGAIGLVAGVAGLTVAVIKIEENRDTEDENRRLAARIDQLTASP